MCFWNIYECRGYFPKFKLLFDGIALNLNELFC